MRRLMYDLDPDSDEQGPMYFVSWGRVPSRPFSISVCRYRYHRGGC